MTDTRRFNAREVREHLLKRGFLPNYVVRYSYRPFDTRWIYWEPEKKLLDEKRSELFAKILLGNVFLVTTSRTRKSSPEPALVTHLLADYNCMDSGARAFPLYLNDNSPQQLNALEQDSNRPNLSASAKRYIEVTGASADELFYHALATTNTLSYRQENAGALRHDWPRIPLPSSRDRLSSSASLGRRIAALQDTEQAVTGITAGTIRSELRLIGAMGTTDGRPLDPSAGDLAVTAGWGFFGHRGAVMAGKGRAVEREYSPEEVAAITAWQNPLGLPLADACALLGETTFDIYLNDRAYWRNVPRRVWEYTMGGYQVLKKWLSYREQEVLGRPLTLDEARLFQHIARRIAALLLLEPQLDANYRAVTEATYPWSASAPAAASTLTLWET